MARAGLSNPSCSPSAKGARLTKGQQSRPEAAPPASRAGRGLRDSLTPAEMW